jgi:3-phenylpropionate/trans-cinnamate dioxygenase ferredoxin subunit
MARYVIGTIDEVQPGHRLIVEVAGRSICVFNIDGEMYGLRNRCPHQGGPLCRGRLTSALTSAVPGEYSYDRTRQVIRCPWHGWEFDVRTGECWIDPDRMRVRAYRVRIETRLDPDTRPIARVERPDDIPGPAETVPVFEVAGFVVVEV